MNDKLLVDTAVLAGELMLVAGAEVYRVEDTINRILRLAHRQTAQSIVLSTGIVVTLDDPGIEAITITKRITGSHSNLNRVYLVNEVSRSLCEGRMQLEEAYEKLLQIQKMRLYPAWLVNLSLVGVCVFFTMLLGGNIRDMAACLLVGLVFIGCYWAGNRVHLNDFCENAVCSFAAALATMSIGRWILPEIKTDLVMIGAIMPLVPGVIFTTAIRDILNGDYNSGSSRILEAMVIAMAVAAGVGTGIGLFTMITGGGY